MQLLGRMAGFGDFGDGDGLKYDCGDIRHALRLVLLRNIAAIGAGIFCRLCGDVAVAAHRARCA